MERTALKNIRDWYASPRRKPLIVRGARQVGKSTLVRQFAEAEKLKLYEINLEQNQRLEKAFSTLDPKIILAEFEATLRERIDPDGSVLFLDEIQATPSAVPALRYLYENHSGLPIIAAGSLLEFVLRDHRFSMPVGRIQYLHLEPMTFSEFLRGIGEDFLCGLTDSWTKEKKISETGHQSLIHFLRVYFYCGGMPEAVSAFGETRRLEESSDVHSEILSTYFDDFSKYRTRIDSAVLRQVFDAVPQAVGKKIKYSKFAPELRSDQIKNCIDLLCLARVVSRVVHSGCNGLPIRAEERKSVYKLLYLDTGLYLRSLGLDRWSPDRWGLERRADEKLVNEGAIAEHFVGQHLLAQAGAAKDRSLHYWLREGKSNNAEVDYVIVRNGQIVPVEVKAGKSGTLRSLIQFIKRHQPKTAVRFDLNLPSVQTLEGCRVISLPLYLVESIDRFE